MTLRNKVLLFALVTATGLVAVLYFGTARVLLGGFAQLEHDYLVDQVQLVEQTLDAEQNGLKAQVLGWSARNDMYDFAAAPDPIFARTELGADALGAMDIDFFVITKSSGDILFSRPLGNLTGEALPAGIRAYLTPRNPMLRYASVYDVHTETTVLARRPALIASAPIVTSEHKGPIRGSLVIGRFLDGQRLAELRSTPRNTMGLKVAFYPIGETPADVTRALESQQRAALVPGHTEQRRSHEVIRGYLKLQDGAGRDTLLLEVTAPRSIYVQAVKSRTALLAVVVTVSAVFVLLTIYLLHRAVLARLAALSRGVQEIAYEGNVSKQLELRGSDEFAKLAADTNHMLKVLEETQRKASENQARYTLVAEGINDGIWDLNLITNETYYSARWRSMLGYPGGAVIDSVEVALSHIHPDDRVRLKRSVDAHLQGETPFFECEARMSLLDGSYRWMLMRGAVRRDPTGRAVRMAGSLTDLTRRGVFDPLTGLPNRLLLREQLDAALAKARAAPDRLSAVLFIDLDRFKLVNDSLGHHVGDLLIVEVAKRLQEAVRPCDTVARLGGDEFVVLLDDLGSKDNLERAVQRISSGATEVLTLAGHQLNISMSAGVIADLGAYSSVDDALRDADNAMYYAKATKRPVAYFNQHMLEQVKERLNLEAELRQAIDNGELSLVHQPIILLRDAKLSGVEALVRWNHPTRGIISPSDFIPLAEETGLIVPLGEWVLRQACLEAKSLAGNFSLGVNLSSRQFDDTLVDRVEAVLKETGLPPQRLILEITEYAVIRDPLLTVSILTRLRALGVRIALDDFGTGYSSLSYLSSLPLDILKLDQAFVSRLMADSQSVAIVRAIISLAKTLGLSVVAEGVETAEQKELLKSLECPYVQGYYFAKPVPVELLTRLAGHSFSVDTPPKHAQAMN